jgi:peroxiredoxin
VERWPRPLRFGLAAAIVLAVVALGEWRSGGGASGVAGAGGGAAEPAGLLDAAPLAIGSVAPDFELATVEGGRARLSEFRGRTVVLNFWASWCPPCRAEMAEFERLYRERLPRADLVVLAVDYRPLDTPAEVRRFLDGFAAREGQPVTFPVLYDTAAGEVAERYGVAPRGARQATLPVSFFIDRDGVLRARVFGPVFGELLPDNVALADAGHSP